MRYGISAAVIIMQDDKILLVNHDFGETSNFWIPPGGRLESDESIFDCARREAFEETGLHVELDRILYIQEFAEPGYHFCKFFMQCMRFHGSLTLANRVDGEDFLTAARFFCRDELENLTVYPEVLRDQFWIDFAAGFPDTRYLGIQRFTVSGSI